MNWPLLIGLHILGLALCFYSVSKLSDKHGILLPTIISLTIMLNISLLCINLMYIFDPVQFYKVSHIAV